MLVKRCPLPDPIRTTDYNSSNHYEYTPYIIKDNKLLIDEEWFLDLTVFIKVLIYERTKGNFILGKVTIPHESQVNDIRLDTIFKCFLDGYDYHIWGRENKDCHFIQLDNKTKKLLHAKVGLPNDVRNKIQNVMEESNHPWFVRLSSTSGKNEIPPKQFFNLQEVEQFLLQCNIFVGREYVRTDKKSYIVLMPWNDQINSRNEMRLFIYNQKLTCVSPQQFWKNHEYTQEELETCQDLFSQTEFDDLMYHSCVIDAWVDFEAKTLNIIELNPFGISSGAGSSLFHWIDDYDLLHGKTTEIIFRYISTICF
jgi:hypothetical protein